MWDSAESVIMQALTIPRGVCLIAGGTYQKGAASGPIVLEVHVEIDHPDWGIVQSPFMRDHAKTSAFRHKLSVDGDTLTYDETTVLDIYGKRFDHTDENTLTRL